MANASFDADDSLLGGSSTSLMSIPDLYPPSGSTLAPPARYHPPPAIDPDLAHTDFDDTHSLLNSPNEHSRSILPGAFADGEDGEQDSFAGLDDDEIQDRLMLDIVGEDGEMSREEERASRRAKAVRDRAALIQAHVDSLSDHLRESTDTQPEASHLLQPPSSRTLHRLLRLAERDSWRYSPEMISVGQHADNDFVPHEWTGGRSRSKAATLASPSGQGRPAAAGDMDVDSIATAAA